jgi:hypothetical protein
MHWLGQRPFELRRATSGRVWLAKGFDTSWQEIRQTLEMLSGCSARVLRLPLPVAQGLGSLVERVCPYAWEPALTRFSVDTMSTDTLFDTRRLSDAGFMPTYALADALSDALGLL